MSESYRKDEEVSRLDKLIESLSSHMTVSSNAAETFISRVRALINCPNKNEEEENQFGNDVTLGKRSILS
jgi:hypothetical protein